jgi:hypothetical protein
LYPSFYLYCYLICCLYFFIYSPLSFIRQNLYSGKAVLVRCIRFMRFRLRGENFDTSPIPGEKKDRLKKKFCNSCITKNLFFGEVLWRVQQSVSIQYTHPETTSYHYKQSTLLSYDCFHCTKLFLSLID